MMAFNSLKQRNNGFGPISFQREQRSHLAALWFVVVSLALLLPFSSLFNGVSFTESVKTNVGTYLGAISSLILGELIRRILYYNEERYHLNERYLGSRKEAFSKCISFSNFQSNVLMLICWISSTVAWHFSKDHYFPVSAYMFVILAIQSFHFAMDYMGARMSGVEISTLSETQIKNVAVGLAWSYYFGYLKLILPGWDGMLERAVKPEFPVKCEDAKDKLASRKLFITMPKNCYCYDKLEEADGRFTPMFNMPTQTINRGGIQERSYKNMLYQVNVNESPLYVMVEYATPLLSIYDMAKDKRSGFSEADLNTQVVEFYKTLEMILDNDPQCRGKYELVLVADVHDNLAEIIRNKITETNLTTH